AGLDPQRVGDSLGVQERPRAEELLAGRRRAAVLDQLGDAGGARGSTPRAHGSRSAPAARDSPGSTPPTPQSAAGPASRLRWLRIVPSWRQPRLVTTRLAASLWAGIRP